MFSFGWWSTGRDRDAINLFETVRDAVERGTVPGKIAYCFLSREKGESKTSDELADCCEASGVQVFSLSAKGFRPELRNKDRGKWRNEYHHKVLGLLRGMETDIVVLAGYMWVVSPEVCEKLNVINLHPAAPSGPAGTWQEVIWTLLENDADETGVMMHLVTPELDKGPPVTFCSFEIKGMEWNSLWKQFENDVKKYGYDGIREKFGENYPLFARIREEGVKRELPLIVQTLRSMAAGDVRIRGRQLVNAAGTVLPGPFDLTREINSVI